MTLLARPTEPTETPSRTHVVRQPTEPEPAADQPRSVSSWTADDWLSLAGAVVASLCLVWLLYTQVLPFSGKLGFVLCWYAVFIATYASVTSVSQSAVVVRDRFFAALVCGAAAVVLLAVASTIIYTFIRGWPAYHHVKNFFTQDMSSTGPLTPLNHGGVSHAIVGSLEELGIAVAFSLPLGLITAVYMTEVGGRLAKVVRTVVEAMTALPDLVAGLFIYALLVRGFGMNRTGFVVALALSITMLPIIARSSEVVLRVVPSGLREASYALGASQWRTVWRVVLPTAKSGLATALILGMARGIGESAPVYVVSLSSGYFNADPLHGPMNSLPLLALNGIRAPDKNSIDRGFGAACVLLAVVLILFAILRFLARQRGDRR